MYAAQRDLRADMSAATRAAGRRRVPRVAAALGFEPALRERKVWGELWRSRPVAMCPDAHARRGARQLTRTPAAWAVQHNPSPEPGSALERGRRAVDHGSTSTSRSA